ncbi:MAG: hypothetical protein QM610_01020 [Chitinophagaceae bacterium]
MCQLRILGRQGSSCAMECVHCSNVYLFYKEVLLILSYSELEIFQQNLRDIDFWLYCQLTVDGQSRMTISSPKPDIHYHLNETEFEDLRSALHEAVCMREVYEMLD